jgi:hypothetical protein
MKEILSDLVSIGTACNGNRNHSTGIVFLEEGSQRASGADLKPVVTWEMSDSSFTLPTRFWQDVVTYNPGFVNCDIAMRR